MDTPDKPATVKVRLSMWPGEDREVPADEVEALRHQGLLLAVDGTAEPGKESPALQASPRTPPAKPKPSDQQGA